MSEGQSFFDKAKDKAGDMKDKVTDMLDGDDEKDQPEEEVRRAADDNDMGDEDTSEGMDMPQSDFGQGEQR